MIYQPKTVPYEWQGKAFDRFRDARLFALFAEPRTGKTKVIIDTAGYRYLQKLMTSTKIPYVDGLLVVAMPGRVHRNWVTKEVPMHLSEEVPRLCVVWDAGRASTKAFQAELDALLAFKGLSVLTVNGESVITTAFRKYVSRFLRARRVFAVADEHTLIMKTPGIKRTRVMHAIGRHPNVVLKAIMDGTPVGEGPLDLYAPMMFLDWRILGYTSFLAFKHHFAEWEQETNWQTGKQYEVIKRHPETKEPIYLNLDELQRKLEPVSVRVRRKDCWDVPEKVYQIYPFQLSTEQRRVYDELREEYETELPTGRAVSARHVLTRYIRLQQISSNYWPSEKVGGIHPACDGDGCDGCDDLGVVVHQTEMRRISNHNPRLAALEEFARHERRPMLIWCRFHQDIDDVMGLGRDLGMRPVQYDGRLSGEQKDRSEAVFQSGEAGWVVGSQGAGGRGLSFSKAELIGYYSNEFSLLKRLQSEERAEEKGKTVGTGIIDFCAEDTVDEIMIDALRVKKKIVDYVMNEGGGRWL